MKLSQKIGFIDYDSMAWTLKATFPKTPTRTMLPSRVIHSERFHPLLSEQMPWIVTKIEVTLKTEKSEYHWTGFSDRMMCGPAQTVSVEAN